MSTIKLLRAWAIILPFMIANGMLRELVLRRDLGDPLAEAVSAALGIAIILVITRILLRPLAGKSNAELARASATLVVLTVAFEFGFGRYMDHRSWAELAANYAVWNGRPWPVVLAILAATPFLWGRRTPAELAAL